MKTSRAKLRGKKLDNDCKRAKRSSHEYGEKDNRIFCYGLNDMSTEALREECLGCKAHVNHVEPLEG